VKLFLDANVVLDVLAAREPYLKASAQILGLVERGKVKGFIAAHSVTTIHYLLSKHLTRKRAQAAIAQLLNVLQVASVDHAVILQALSLGWPDFEDAVQAAAALNVKATVLITRNPRDFKTLPIEVLTPEEWLQSSGDA